MKIIKTGVLTLFLSIITFPSIIMGKITSWLYEEPEEEPLKTFDPTTVIQMHPSEDSIDSELLILQRLDKARDNAKNPVAKQMWEIKKAEYIRKVKWKQLQEIAGASERVA